MFMVIRPMMTILREKDVVYATELL
jgi:hypothetical protein